MEVSIAQCAPEEIEADVLVFPVADPVTLPAAAQAVAGCHDPRGEDHLTAVPTVMHAGDATIERAWRDGNAGSVHAANDTERWLATYGKGAFGLPIEDAMI